MTITINIAELARNELAETRGRRVLKPLAKLHLEVFTERN